MKTKLEMAHDYAMTHGKTKTIGDRTDMVKDAWAYADEMQAEADKRKVSGVPDELLTKDHNGKCTHFHTTFGRKECFDCGESLINWQPDWSQAPRHDVVAWDINEHGQARWIASDNGYYLAPSFDYKGDWKESLRNRP